MSKKLCREAIETRLGAWANARMPKLPIAWENAPFSPPSTTYLRAFLMPASTAGIDLEGAGKTYSGIYQISVIAPINTGPGAAEAISDEIAALYPLNIRLVVPGLTLQVVSPVNVPQGIADGDRYTLPVWFQYRADVI